MISRDAVDKLVARDGLKDMLARPQGDFINRFPNLFTRDTREQLFRHFKDFASIDVSNDSGIARLRAIAFTPDDALALNKAMLRNAEGFRQPAQLPHLQRFAGAGGARRRDAASQIRRDRGAAHGLPQRAEVCSTPTRRSPTG